MRTTLVLDDDLLRQVRHRAVDEGLTLSALVNRLLRAALGEVEPPAQEPFHLPESGPTEPTLRLEPRDIWAMMENDDVESLR